MNKAVLFYVEQTLTVHIVLFYMWAQMFLLISCSLVVAFQYFLCFVHSEGQQASKKRTKVYNKKTGKFHSQSRFIN